MFQISYARSILIAQQMLAIFVILCAPNFAATDDDQAAIHFRRISTEHGLSHARVHSVHQDMLGFMWFGTEDGLNRFDGYEFKTFRPEPQGDREESTEYALRTVFEDREGYLWLGGYFARRLDRFDPRTHRFVEHHRTAGLGHILRLRNGTDGTIWIGTSWTGLWNFDPATGEFRHYPLDVLDGTNKRQGQGTIYQIFATTSDPDVLWLGTQFRGLVRFDARTGEMESIHDNEGLEHAVPPPQVETSFLQDSGDVIWIGGDNAHLYKFDTNAKRFLGKIRFDDPDNGFIARAVAPAFCDSKGRLWVSSDGAGVGRLDLDTNTFHRHLHDSRSEYSLSDNVIGELFVDRSGMAWARTGSAGLCVFDPQGDWIRHHQPLAPDHLGANPVAVNCFLLGEDENLVWLGTDKGLAKWNRSTGKLTYVETDTEGASPGNKIVLSACPRKAGGIWIGTRSGLNFYDPSADIVRRFLQPTDSELNVLNGASTFAIHEDDSGELWLGRKPGLLRVNFNAGTARHYRHDPKNDASIRRGTVKHIHEDRKGRIWIGADRGGGLLRLDRKTDQFTHYLHDPTDLSSMSDNRIRGIHEDSEADVLWVATNNGLNRVDSETGTVKRFSDGDGLPNSLIHGSVEDAAGNLWLSTRSGLARIGNRLEDVPEILSFDNVGGVNTRDWQPGVAFSGGNLYFNTLRGFIELQPERLPSMPPPKVFLTEFELLGRSVEPSPDERTVLATDISITGEIVLNHEMNKVISFKFATPDSYSPDSVRYAHRLDGLEDDWTYTTGAHRTATYSTLPPGDYTFRVKAANSHGVWSEDDASVRLSVLPPWWRTWWFQTLGFAIVVAAIVGVYAWRTSEIREQHRIRTKSDERYLNLLTNTSEQLWCIEFDEPVSLDLPEMEQVDRIFNARVVEANIAFAEAYGTTLEEVLLWRVADFIPRDLPSSVPFLQDAVRSGYRMQDVETTEKAIDGSTKYFVNSFIGTIKDNHVLRVWGMARDVTETREVKEQIRLRQTAIENANVGFVIADATQPDMPLIYANQRFQKMTGYGEDETLGKNCRFLLGKNTNPETIDAIREALANKEPFVGEILNYRKNGEVYWNFLRLSPVFDGHGALTHYVGMSTDVSDRKKSEELIKIQRGELAHFSRVSTIGEFGAALAHELNQPMAAILRNADAALRMLENDQTDLKELHEIMSDILRDDQRAGKILDRIRYYTKKSENPHVSVNVNDLIRECMVLLKNELMTHELDVDLQLASDLPLVQGDPIELQQVIINLVLNAENAMQQQADDRKLRITSELDQDGNVQISVSDNGPGIHQRDLERVFMPFHTTKKDGMGMGLAINRTIINAHEGRIWAEQNGPRGAKLVVSLPPQPETGQV